MLTQTVLAIICGISAGVVTGLIPGVHINLISLLLVTASGAVVGVEPILFGVFIIAMSVTHTFLDSIPSTFLGAPDADMALNVLPAHRMLLRGEGYNAVKLTVIGSLLSLIVVVVLIPVMIPLAPLIYEFIQPFIGWILVGVVVYIILIEKGIKKKTLGMFVFLLSGFLGIIVLGIPNLSNPLFAMLSGLFGVSTLVISLKDDNKIPEQKFESETKLEHTGRAIGAAVFSGSLTGLFPGLGSAQAAMVGMQIVGKIGVTGFMMLIGGINTVNFIFSLVTFYTLEKARNGGIVALQQIVENIGFYELIVLVSVVLITGGVATVLALRITKIFAVFVGKINYRKVCYSIIFLIVILTLLFNGVFGLLILFTSTIIGMLPAFFCVKRSLAMGCLLLPVILFFLF